MQRTDLDLLESEDIGRSDVLVAVIETIAQSLFACLLGRQLGISRIIRESANAPNPSAVRARRHRRRDFCARCRRRVGPCTKSGRSDAPAGRVVRRGPVGFSSSTCLRATRPVRCAIWRRRSTASSALSCSSARFSSRAATNRVEPGDRLIVFTTYAAADQLRQYFTGVRA